VTREVRDKRQRDVVTRSEGQIGFLMAAELIRLGTQVLCTPRLKIALAVHAVRNSIVTRIVVNAFGGLLSLAMS
jgi:hypothetical protein